MCIRVTTDRSNLVKPLRTLHAKTPHQSYNFCVSWRWLPPVVYRTIRLFGPISGHAMTYRFRKYGATEAVGALVGGECQLYVDGSCSTGQPTIKNPGLLERKKE